MFPALNPEEPWSVALSPESVTPAGEGEGGGEEEEEEEEDDSEEDDEDCEEKEEGEEEGEEEEEARIQRAAALRRPRRRRRRRRAGGPTLKSVLASAFGDAVTSLSIDSSGRSARGGKSKAATKSKGLKDWQPEPQ